MTERNPIVTPSDCEFIQSVERQALADRVNGCLRAGDCSIPLTPLEWRHRAWLLDMLQAAGWRCALGAQEIVVHSMQNVAPAAPAPGDPSERLALRVHAILAEKGPMTVTELLRGPLSRAREFEVEGHAARRAPLEAALEQLAHSGKVVGEKARPSAKTLTWRAQASTESDDAAQVLAVLREKGPTITLSRFLDTHFKRGWGQQRNGRKSRLEAALARLVDRRLVVASGGAKGQGERAWTLIDRVA